MPIFNTGWEITHRNLTRLFPDADSNAWKIKRYQYSDEEFELLEKELGFELYPEDKVPEFFIAHDSAGRCCGKRSRWRETACIRLAVPRAVTYSQ